MQSPSLQPASVLFKSVTVFDCFASSARDEESAAMVDGFCRSQFPLLCCFGWKTYRLIPSHVHDGTEVLLLLRYGKINDTVTSLPSTHMVTTSPQHAWICNSCNQHSMTHGWCVTEGGGTNVWGRGKPWSVKVWVCLCAFLQSLAMSRDKGTLISY